MWLEKKSVVRTQELSYGDKRKLEIAIALSLTPRILLLDEPFAGLSDAEIEELLHLIRKISGKFALVIIEHKISRMVGLVDRLNVMHEGRMIAEGVPEEVLKDATVREVYWGKEEVLQCSLS
jgi:branched-chain amino acid transport system ATP-binding protein